MPLTSSTSCSCVIGRVSGCNNIVRSLSVDVLNTGDVGGELEASFSISGLVEGVWILGRED
jgi:hypothetical protein